MDSGDWSESILKPALANFLGTLGAALVIFLVGVAAGVLDDVPVRVWISVGGASAGTLMTVLLIDRAARARAPHRGSLFEQTLASLDDETRNLVLESFKRELTPEEEQARIRGIVAAAKRMAAARSDEPPAE